jgi:N-acetyl-anhydromuramyl-L-alanine amidase AmpD
MKRYTNSTLRLSPVHHPQRPSTWGLVIHWTAGREAGDLAALTGGKVDVHFYVTKTGKVYQILDAGSEAWHAFATANDHCVGIEHEGSGEPYTAAQLKASAKLAAWVCKTYGIPVKHVDPHVNWRGIFGHRDLRGIDGNDHTDTVPAGTGWPRYLAAVKAAGAPRIVAPYYAWVQWRLGEGAFKGDGRANPAKRPADWLASVPRSYGTRLRAFLKARG